MHSGTPQIRTTESVAFSATRRLHGFDAFALAGGLINLIVIVLLIGYWLLH